MLQENMKRWRDRKQQEWIRDGEARMLIRQLQRRFGDLPSWVSEKIFQAEPPSLEEWGLRFVDAQTLDAVFADRT
ncbi:MAG: DUF4351 domain-containing protein [Magnetococcus sp. YQC-5]